MGNVSRPDYEWGLDFHSLFTYQRNLPHWRQEGAVYFVTFRLKDSIPREVVEAWREDRRRWLEANGVVAGLGDAARRERYRAIPETRRRAYERDQARQFFVALDQCHGECLLRKPPCAEIVAGALQFFDGVRLLCGDFVIMPNHIHWLLLPLADFALEDILQSVKSWTAREINKCLGRTGSLWQKENFDRIVRDEEEYERTREYIAANPVKARLRDEEFLCRRADLLGG